jgi:hypothetical protein
MPKDVADKLKKQGHWKDDDGKQGPSGLAPGSHAVIIELDIMRWCWHWARARSSRSLPSSARGGAMRD